MTIDKPFVSIIVLNYNGKKWLKDCFESLRNLEYPKDKYEVIMGDNASTDDSVEYVKENFPWVKILELDKNYGYAGGNNRCTKIAKGGYIIFLNPDTKVDANWVMELVKPVLIDKNIKICGSKNLHMENNKVLAFGGSLTNIGAGTCENKLNKTNIEKEYIFIGYGIGSSLLVEKKIFENIDRFDETYFMYNEETDLCWRAWIYGYKVAVSLHASIYRKTDIESKKREKFLFHIIKNQLMSVLKNFELYNLIYSLVISFFYNLFQIVKYSLLKRPHNIINIIKAHLFVIKNLPEIFKKRRKIQKNRKISDKELYKMGLILPLSKSIKKEIELSKMELHGT